MSFYIYFSLVLYTYNKKKETGEGRFAERNSGQDVMFACVTYTNTSELALGGR